MNVPRGTQPRTRRDAWRVKCLLLPRPWRIALLRGLKTELRVPLSSRNCVVHPGKFGGLDLESGRARPGTVATIPQLRARCLFPSGSSRAVTVTPTFCRGDLLWVRAARRSRKASRLTLEVLSVDVVRVRDMSDADARAEGVAALPFRLRHYGTALHWFAEFWEVQHGGRAWRANAWCWLLKFQVHHENVDDLVFRWGGMP